jgi:hypothetical protein
VDAAGNAEGCAPVTGTVSNIATGDGLTGGPITTSGTLAIATGGVSNAMLANNSINIVAGNAMFGGGTVALGGSVTLHNAGVTSITGTPNEIETTATIGTVTISLPPSGVKLPGKSKLTAGGSTFAPLNMPSSINPQWPESGDIWNEGGLLRLQNGSETKAIVTASSTAFSVNIAPLGLIVNPQACVLTGDFGVSVPNAAVGDPVVVALPQDWGAIPGDPAVNTQELLVQAWVNSPGKVLVRVCNAGGTQRTLPQHVFISGRVLKF